MFGWHFLNKIGNFEIWKTPTKYLVCYKIRWVFIFTDTYQEALDIAKVKHQELINSHSN